MGDFRTGVRGQEAARRVLASALASGRLGHAYLLHGPAGVGKTTLARDFARALACDDQAGCGACPPCRRFESGNFGDFLPLPEEGASLGIAEVRSLVTALGRAPVEGKRKTALIPRAERLTPEAQNALLKTLEAPPAGAVLLLTADSPEALLPTIVSRCQLLRCGRLPRGLIAEILEGEGLEPEEARRAAETAEGSVGLARGLAGDDTLAQAAAGVWETILKGDLAGVYAVAAELGDREGARALFEGLARLAGRRCGEDPDDEWAAHAARELEHTALLIAWNANLRLAAETVLGGLALRVVANGT
ncbi:MAG TPA: DNA polymerase III subunit delta' [bacterium]|nr:DNA polymerase III subunit delta' [bacterium]